ncbi:hypothetical protein TGS27_2200 [Geobacillus stearothermophilus]|uniref:Uncharacterized protein n=1 Tax=Geobacillus stearothermophilus TaxID=1422 RepID=A0A150MAG8_GEOSE|nr:hypothetical protein GS8_2735 [Geobacillus stearothermophilus]KYD21498.1 hypothetical protein B4109_2445 [Geobacillus stearothermophilus]OAO79446.1 hypothetical protein TGS27_2200 [Geobacillus stearothermophilus]
MFSHASPNIKEGFRAEMAFPSLPSLKRGLIVQKNDENISCYN